MSEGFNIDDFIKNNIDNSSTDNTTTNNNTPSDLTISSSPLTASPTTTTPTTVQPAIQPTVQPVNQPSGVQPETTTEQGQVTTTKKDEVYAPGTIHNNVHFTSEQVAANGTAQPRISADDIVVGGEIENKGEVISKTAQKMLDAQNNYKPPSKFKVFCLVLFFILLIAFAIFLPEISTFIQKYKSGGLNPVDEKITSGKLECTLTSSTANLDLTYKRVFKFTDSSLDSAEFILTTKGDPTADEATLNAENEKCVKLKDISKSVNGFSVSCEYSDGKLVQTQSFNYGSINPDSVDSAFAEAGGVNPEFSAGQDIDVIEKNMNASNYSCLRSK